MSQPIPFNPSDDVPRESTDQTLGKQRSECVGSEEPNLNKSNIDQAEMRRLYLEQLRKRSCPGCGEGELFG